MISLDEAQAHVLERVDPLAPRPVPLADAHGLVTAAPVVTTEAVPPFANTAMDGFAVQAADTGGASEDAPRRLRVVDTVLAGAAPSIPVGPGEAIRIMTGAPMPDGADAVVMVERTTVQGDDVLVTLEVASGNHVRAAGDDLQVGDEVVGAGEELRAAHLGVLASVGVLEPVVFPRVHVGVLSTGDELVGGGGPLQPGQIRDSNRLALLALVERSGWEPVDLGLVRDDEAAITAAISDGAAQCDALVTSGGVSMGDVDLIKVVLDRLGDMRWMQIAIKPAKPFAFGVVQGTPVFGLPGNPVSSMVSFELLARPALRKMSGQTQPRPPRIRAVADEQLRRHPDGKVHFVRVASAFGDDGRLHVRSSGGQGSHQLTAMMRADALAVLPDGDGVNEGGEVEVLLLS